MLSQETILATNTSSIPITRIAAATRRPDKVIGMHFMNPVPVMKLVEIILGLATSESTKRTTLDVVQRMGKTCVFSRDVPGFIVNRILMPMINEAVFALYEHVGTTEDIDAGMKLGTNQPMGPLQLADLIGLDTCLSILEVLHRGLGDSKYRPCPLLRQYVDAGFLGRKTGRGFYTYEG
jgi:3-hydroxybutyryl-CoA dehydrogenase